MIIQSTIQKLTPDDYFHIYNRGNNKETIFKAPENYIYFLSLWKKYIQPVAETFCYNLLPNHFHFFIRIREIPLQTSNEKTCDVSAFKPIEQHFSNLFNAYSKAINKRFNRTGSLFQERFRRKEIISEEYYSSIVGYIITNAVKHGFCKTTENYQYSAYSSLLSIGSTLLLRDEVLDWFGGKMGFIKFIKDYEEDLHKRRYFFENENDDD
jgi:REP element-mobilizing transposase RayT